MTRGGWWGVGVLSGMLWWWCGDFLNYFPVFFDCFLLLSPTPLPLFFFLSLLFFPATNTHTFLATLLVLTFLFGLLTDIPHYIIPPLDPFYSHQKGHLMSLLRFCVPPPPLLVDLTFS